MALQGKVETEFEIKASADQFYNVFRSQAHQVPNATPDHIQGIEVHEGDWETHGSVKSWKYTVEGNAEVFKEKVEFDDENRKITQVGVDGHVMKDFKNIKAVYQVIPKGDGSVAKLSIEYEKLQEDVPTPDKYLNLMVNVTKDIDAHLVKA